MEALLVVTFLAVYFAPTMVANLRNSKFGTPIFLLNLLLGWTILGWIGALIWSVMPNDNTTNSIKS